MKSSRLQINLWRYHSILLKIKGVYTIILWILFPISTKIVFATKEKMFRRSYTSFHDRRQLLNTNSSAGKKDEGRNHILLGILKQQNIHKTIIITFANRRRHNEFPRWFGKKSPGTFFNHRVTEHSWINKSWVITWNIPEVVYI